MHNRIADAHAPCRRLLAAPKIPRNTKFCTDVLLIICAVARLRIKIFRDGICVDSTLFKMLWFPDHVVPGKFSAVQIPDRTTSRRPGVFARERDEPTFQTKVKDKRQVWEPSGMAGSDLVALSDSDEECLVAPCKTRRPVAPPKPRQPTKKVDVNGFLRRGVCDVFLLFRQFSFSDIFLLFQLFLGG